MKVLIELNRNNVVQRIENNTENEQYRKLKAEVGDKLDEQLIALLLMNPHRFQVIRSEVTR